MPDLTERSAAELEVLETVLRDRMCAVWAPAVETHAHLDTLGRVADRVHAARLVAAARERAKGRKQKGASAEVRG